MEMARKEENHREIDARERLILALDVGSEKKAEELITQLDGYVNIFKLNFRLIFGGVNLVQFIDKWTKEGKDFFVDLKWDDTTDTVTNYIKDLSEKKVKFCTVHGNSKTIDAALKGRNGHSQLKLLFVTVLSSLDDSDIKDLYITDKKSLNVENLALARTRVALEHGIDGVIATGHEAKKIKQMNKDLIIVTPGVRLEGNSHDDHKRVSTPEFAIENGSDYLVVGRPIYNSDNPVNAAKTFLKRMQKAFDDRENL